MSPFWVVSSSDLSHESDGLNTTDDFGCDGIHPGRMVETGILPNYEPWDFALHFEGFPIWLLALEKSFCKRLVILGFASASTFRRGCEHCKLSMPLVHRAIAHLGLSRVHYQLDLAPPLGMTVLLSGTVSFLVAAVLTTFGACPSLSMCSSH
jgi:hypothetical protein